MVAGGVTFAIPGAIPEAAAQSTNENLYVSAENAMFDNKFSGLNVVEVVVRDPSINERGDRDDVPSAEPRVEVDGDQLRMVQGNDGNWYGYFAEVNIDDATDAINYGEDCTTSITITDDFESDSVRCATDGDHPVIRTAKDANTAAPNNTGSIGLADVDDWPFIQVYSFDDESDIVVEYQKGGSTQSVTLYYDSDPDEYGTGLELGRDRYPQGGGVIMTMTDLAMNVDPTDEDTWTFDTTGTEEAYYYVFDDDGVATTNTNPAAIDRDLEGIDDNLYLTITPDVDGTAAVDFRERWDGNQNDGGIASTGVGAIDDIVTFIETGSNTGVFTNTDSDSDTPNLFVPVDAKRGTSAVIDHNDGDKSVVVGHAFGTITLDDDAVGGVWNSGEEIPVTLTDADVNRMAMSDEDITVSDPSFTIIPSVRIGSPITLDNAESVMIGDIVLDDAAVRGTAPVDAFSDVMRLMPKTDSVNGTITFKEVVTGETLWSYKDDQSKAIKPATFQFFNFDTRSIGTLDNAKFQWADGSVNIPDVDGSNQDLVEITDILNMIPNNSTVVDIVLDIDIDLDNSDNAECADDTICAGNMYPIVVDLFSFGQKGDGVAASERINNAIYRLELEESGDNTGIFEGTMEYIMLNQINVRNSDTYAGIDPISDAVIMIVHNDLTDEDSIRVNYRDLGADGVYTQIADQVEAPTTSGSVSFDADNYKVADTVTVTLEDADLNVDVATIEIYTTVTQTYKPTATSNANYSSLGTDAEIDSWRNSMRPNSTADGTWVHPNGYWMMSTNTVNNVPVHSIQFIRDVAFDQIGASGYGRNSANENFGRVLDITFDDKLWLNGCEIGGDNGLGSTGFTLIETGADTGVFTGDFQVPLQYCHRISDSAAVTRSTTGVDMEVNYVKVGHNSRASICAVGANNYEIGVPEFEFSKLGWGIRVFETRRNL